MSAATLSQVCAGDFIYSRLFAWRGAFGVVSTEFDGCFVSNEFPTFRPINDRLDVSYLNLWFKLPRVLGQVAADCTGSTPLTRNRYKEQFFLKLEIPLPPVDEQRRIVRRIERLATNVGEMVAARSAMSRALDQLTSTIWSSGFPEEGGGVVGDYVSVQSGYAFRSEWFQPEGIRLVRNVNIGHGVVLWNQTVSISEARRAEFQGFELRVGDILVSLDRPIISTGVKVARVRPADLPSLLLQRVGRCLIRTPELDPDYLFHWLQSPRFAGAIDPGRSNGVPHISPKDVERIPFTVPLVDEQARVVRRLRSLTTRQRALHDLRARIESEIGAVVPSVLRREM